MLANCPSATTGLRDCLCLGSSWATGEALKRCWPPRNPQAAAPPLRQETARHGFGAATFASLSVHRLGCAVSPGTAKARLLSHTLPPLH